MSDSTTTLVVHLKLKPGAEKRVLELRPLMAEEFVGTNTISATLHRVEGTDEWRDIVVLKDRAYLEEIPQTPAYQEWLTLVDYLKFEVLERAL